MSKRLNINLIDEDIDCRTRFHYYNDEPELYEFECSNILKKFEGKTLCREDAVEAIDTLIAYYYQEKICRMIIDIGKRNESLEPAKEMTLEQIEKMLGHKVKIVSDKEKQDE